MSKDLLRDIIGEICYVCGGKITKIKSVRCDGDAKICENKNCQMFIDFNNICETWKYE